MRPYKYYSIMRESKDPRLLSISLPPFLGHKTGKIKVIISLPRGLNFSRI